MTYTTTNKYMHANRQLCILQRGASSGCTHVLPLTSWYTTSRMPAWMSSLAHSLQGNSVTYMRCRRQTPVAPPAAAAAAE
jgi:hypothetical protein